MTNTIKGNDIKIKLIKSECECKANCRGFKCRLDFQFDPYLVLKRQEEYIVIKNMTLYRSAYEISSDLVEIDDYLRIDFTDVDGNYVNSNNKQYININKEEFRKFWFDKSESILRNFILSYNSEYSVLVSE